MNNSVFLILFFTIILLGVIFYNIITTPLTHTPSVITEKEIVLQPDRRHVHPYQRSIFYYRPMFHKTRRSKPYVHI